MNVTPRAKRAGDLFVAKLLSLANVCVAKCPGKPERANDRKLNRYRCSIAQRGCGRGHGHGAPRGIEALEGSATRVPRENILC